MTLNLILLDSREPTSILKLDYGIPVLVQELKAGDAWLVVDDLPAGQAIVVERKTAPDLLKSIANNRLFNQCAEMRQVSEWCYLLITAWPHLLPENWPLVRVMGTLATVQELGITVMWCAENDYADTLLAIANHARCDVRIKPRRNTAAMTREEQILASLPGIANERAHALIEHCGCVADALTFLTTDGGGSVPGIGKATREGVCAALGMRPGCGLWQISDEDATELDK